MKVKATKVGFIYGLLRSKGDIFTLVAVGGQSPERQFSKNWMRCIDEPAEDVKEEKPKTQKPKAVKSKATKSK
jgi:hypothetical protein